MLSVYDTGEYFFSQIQNYCFSDRVFFSTKDLILQVNQLLKERILYFMEKKSLASRGSMAVAGSTHHGGSTPLDNESVWKREQFLYLK